MKIATNPNLVIYKALVLCSEETLLIISHDVRVQQKVRKSKESNETDDVTHEKPGFEVVTKRITKSNKFLGVTVKFLSRSLGSTFTKSTSITFGNRSKLSQIFFALSKLFIKLIGQAEVHEKNEDWNRSLKVKEEMGTLRLFSTGIAVSLSIQK